jgi:hypothetical protein
MGSPQVTINRAPVLTLWAAVVAERLGYDRDAALTLGQAVAGLNAQSKGRRLGILEDAPDHDHERQPRARQPVTPTSVPLLGRQVPVIPTAEGVRATRQDQPIDPRGVTRYVQQTFGAALPDVRAAMAALAAAYPPEQLAAKACALYERFRPAIPEGTRGWGAAGRLDLDLIRALAPQATWGMRRRHLWVRTRVRGRRTVQERGRCGSAGRGRLRIITTRRAPSPGMTAPQSI